MMTTHTSPTKVLIAGGGFAGVRVARRLHGRPDLEVTLISSSDYFSYYPQLYHAATGGARAEASIPLPDLLDGMGVRFVKDTVTVLDAAAQTVQGASGEIYHYDKLVLALGSVTNYFGIPGLKEFSYDIKTIEGAERFKVHLHDQLTRGHKPELHYVIVGGGPTGIELASALGEYLHRIVSLHGIGAPKYQVDLVEGAPRLLPRMAEGHAARIHQRLTKLGVNVMTGAVVEGANADGLQLKGQSLASKTVVWTAGVSNNPFFATNADDFTLAKNGRVQVDEHMEARPHVYVLGDNAATPYGGLALTAIVDADYAARDILRTLNGEARKPYKPLLPTSVIPVGTGWAAVEWGNLRIYGWIGWMIRRIADLVGYMDIEAFSKAFKVWRQDRVRQDDCPVCRKRDAASV